MEKFFVSINGLVSKGHEAKISVFDRGFLYGDSVYEATRTFNAKAFRLDFHLERLFLSAKKLEFTPLYSKELIKQHTLELIKESQFQNAQIRIVLTRGDNEDLGLNPLLSKTNNLIIYTKEIAENPKSWLIDGVSMIFYEKTSHHKGSLPKTGNYQENMLAYKSAQDKKAYDAFMVNPEGFVTEGTTSNAWVVKGQKIYTPPLTDGVLEGLTRKTIFELAARNICPYLIEEKSLTPQDFLTADECFITSTTRNILPVTRINNLPIGSGKPGICSLKLLDLYLEFVQKDY